MIWLVIFFAQPHSQIVLPYSFSHENYGDIWWCSWILLVLLKIYKYGFVLITLVVQYLLMLPSTLVFILLMLVLASSPRMDGWHPQKSLSWNVLHHILPNASLLSILFKGTTTFHTFPEDSQRQQRCWPKKGRKCVCPYNFLDRRRAKNIFHLENIVGRSFPPFRHWCLFDMRPQYVST